MQQIEAVRPQDYSWRSEESELISAILGSAQQRDVENEPMGATMDSPRRMNRRSDLPVSSESTVPTQTHDIERLVASLTEEIRNHRSEIRELQMLVQKRPFLLSSASRGPWWRKWLLRFSY